MRHTDLLRHRILTAVMSTLVAGTGCKSTTPEARESTEPTSTSAKTPTPPQRVKPKPASPPPASPCGTTSPVEECFEPNRDLRFQGEVALPSTPPPPATFDANGCQALKEASNSCCNAAASGPRFSNGKCCYDFCAGPCCGRPFIVAHAPRVAPCSERGDWSGDQQSDPQPRLAQAWLDDALMEHASIASLSRFGLQLMSLGAPPELLTACHRAALDEVAHAEACFALASRFAGRALGPGPLDVHDPAPPETLEDIAVATFREGCVGETIAALIAANQLDGSRDPQVRDCLERIARDEAAHAELAWRALTWTLGQLTVTRRERLLARLVDTAITPEQPAGPWSEEWRALGRLHPREHADVAKRAVREVIEPALRRLVHPQSQAVATAPS